MDSTVILIPMFDDWDAAALLLRELDTTLAETSMASAILFIDDGSTSPMPPDFVKDRFAALRSIDVLHLRRNLGHQRAIAVGLVYIYQNVPCRAVIVMDSDGEDRPSDIPALAAKFDREQERCIIFAARAKRLETPLFRILYQLYRMIHIAITGDPVRVGNFSIVPRASLAKLVVIPEIWYHYAAAVIRSRIAFQTIPLARGKRFAGVSKMNFIALLLHGLSAFFVYGDIVGARLLVGIAIALILEIAAVTIGLASHFSVYLAVLLGAILLQAIPIALILVFIVIGSRVNMGFLPLRDCPYFAGSVERLFPVAD